MRADRESNASRVRIWFAGKNAQKTTITYKRTCVCQVGLLACKGNPQLCLMCSSTSTYLHSVQFQRCQPFNIPTSSLKISSPNWEVASTDIMANEFRTACAYVMQQKKLQRSLQVKTISVPKPPYPWSFMKPFMPRDNRVMKS